MNMKRWMMFSCRAFGDTSLFISSESTLSLFLIAIAWVVSFFVPQPAFATSDSWYHIADPFGFAVDIGGIVALDDGNLLLAARNQGLFRSSDGGMLWDRATGDAWIDNVRLLKKDSRGRIYTDSAYSDDLGVTWQRYVPPVDADAIYIDPNDRLYIINYRQGVYRSSDAGASWIRLAISEDLDTGPVLWDRQGRLFVGTDWGIVRSTDDGISWSVVNEGLTKLPIKSLAYTASDDILAGTNGGGLFRSTDNGLTWQNINIGIYNAVVWNINVTSDNSWHLGITYNRARAIITSKDNGQSWIRTDLLPQDLAPPDIYPVGGDTLLAGTRRFFGFYPVRTGLLLRSTDGGETWHTLYTGIVSQVTINTLLVRSEKFILAGSKKHGLFLSNDKGVSWQSIGQGLPSSSILSIDMGRDSMLYCGTVQGGYRSYDSGVSWKPMHIPSNSDTVWKIVALNDEILFARTSDGLFRTLDAGSSWEMVSQIARPGDMVLGKDVFWILDNDSLKYTTDAGTTWNIENNYPLNTPALLAGDKTFGTLVAAGEQNVAYRDSQGAWSILGGKDTIPKSHLTAVLLIEQDFPKDRPVLVTVGVAWRGVYGWHHPDYIYDDERANWGEYSRGLQSNRICALGFLPLSDRPGIIFAGTVNGGVARTEYGQRPVSVPSTDSELLARPDITISPHPLYGSEALINVQGVVPSTISRFTVHDILGRKIVDESMDRSSKHQWHCDDVPPGVYLISVYDRDGQILASTKVVRN